MIKHSSRLPEQALSRTTIGAGDYYIGIVKAGQTLRLLDLEGNQAADTLFFSAANPVERYSATDTIREQLFAIETRLAAGGHPVPVRSFRIY